MFRHSIKNLVRFAGRRSYSDAAMKEPVGIPVLSGERGVNKVTLFGRAGADAEMRGPTDRHVVMFSLATSQSYRSESGNYTQFTDWHRVSVFRPALRDKIAMNIKKGDRVYVSGAIRYSQYTDQDGKNVSSVNIVADDIMNATRSTKYDTGTASYEYQEKE